MFFNILVQDLVIARKPLMSGSIGENFVIFKPKVGEY